MTNPVKPRWSSRAMIVLIALTSAVPFGLAWYYARHPELIEKTSNYGTLILPARQLEPVQLVTDTANPEAALGQIKGRWLLLQVASGNCAASCIEALHKTHQAWLMLNKEMPRVQRLLLASPESQVRAIPEVASDDALLITGLTLPVQQALTSAIGKPPGEGALILLDPLGNLVLWYDTGFDPYKLVKDLKHLLKASQIG
jgi:hypothetical protein